MLQILEFCSSNFEQKNFQYFTQISVYYYSLENKTPYLNLRRLDQNLVEKKNNKVKNSIQMRWWYTIIYV